MEGWLEEKISVSGLLAVVAMACVIKMKSPAFVSKRLLEKENKKRFLESILAESVLY